VARKKKTRKSKKAEGEKKPPAEVTAAETSEGEEGEPAAENASLKPKKKRARKKAEKKKEEEAEQGDGADKRKSGKKKGGRKKKDAAASVEVETLAAEVAVLDEVAAGEQAAVPIDEPEETAVPVEDIDAVLDDDETEDLAALIAQTAAGAGPEVHHVEEPEDLDEGFVAIEPPEAAEPEGEQEPAPVEVEDVAASAPADASEGEEEPEAEFDLTGAIDLGPEITPELRDRLLAQALAHAEIQDARYRVPYADRSAGRWKALVAVGLVLVAGILLAAPPSWVRPDPPAQLDAADRARALRTALLLQSQQVDAYRVRNQRLPESLDELPQSIPGLRYVRSGNRAYQIIAYEQDGNAIIYDSSAPSPEFGRLGQGFVPGDAP
jgi:hypothetical protein